MASATATAQRTKSGYQLDKTEYELQRARELRQRKREEERAEVASQAAARKDNIIHAEDRFGRRRGSPRSLLAHERTEESGFGTEEPDVSEYQDQDVSPLEMEAARGGLYQPDVGGTSRSAVNQVPEEQAGAEDKSEAGLDRDTNWAFAGRAGVPASQFSIDQEQQEEERRHATDLRQAKRAEMSMKAKMQDSLQAGIQKPIEEIERNIKRIKAVVTLVGGLASLTLWGIMWTVFQWNLQAAFTVFNFPGEKYFGLPMPKVLWGIIVTFIDVIFILLVAVALIIVYYATHIGTAIWDLLSWDLLKTLVVAWFS